jgi:hypothetical protein
MSTTLTGYATKIIEGVEVEFRVRTRRVVDMSDWGEALRLARAGLLESKFYQYLYGHTDYFVPE